MPRADSEACETPTITVPTARIPHTLLLTLIQQGEAGYPTEHVLTPPSPPGQQLPQAQPPSCRDTAPEPPEHIPEGRLAADHTPQMCQFPTARAHLNPIKGRCPRCSARCAASPAWLAAAHQPGHLLTHFAPEEQLCACRQSRTGSPLAPKQPGISINASQGFVFPDTILGADRKSKRGLNGEAYFSTYDCVCSPRVFLTYFISNHPQG